MELKIKGTVSKKQISTEIEDGEIQINDICAVFIPDWNKWIRCAIKSMDKNNVFNVWAIDYGVPFVSKSSQIVKLPPIYIKMNNKYQRIQLGGIANCIPAESDYDVDTDRTVLKCKSNWSANAIGIARNIIGRAVNLKFENYNEMNVATGSHLFGNLIVQKSDGTCLDLAKCLSNAFVAKIATDDWLNQLQKQETIKQNEWQSENGMDLQAKITVEPISVEKIVNKVGGITLGTIAKNAESNKQSIASSSENNHKNEAMPMKSNNDRQLNFTCENNNNRSLSQRNFNVSKSIHGVQNQNYHNPKYPFNRTRYSNRDDYSSQFPRGWHTHGRLRDQNYRQEVEFFESSFRKTTPIKNDDSSHENSLEEPKVLETSEHDQIQKTNNENANGSHEKSTTKIKSIDNASVGKETNENPGKVDLALNSVINDQQAKKDEKQNEGNTETETIALVNSSKLDEKPDNE